MRYDRDEHIKINYDKNLDGSEAGNNSYEKINTLYQNDFGVDMTMPV